MQNNIVIGRVGVVFMLNPPGRVDMDLYATDPFDVADLYTCVEEVGTGMRIPLAGIEDLYVFSRCCRQFIFIEILELPEVMQE